MACEGLASAPLSGWVLGFDTSAAHCAAALVKDGVVVTAREEAMSKGQAERLMPLLEEILTAAGIGWQTLDRLGVGIGPGNFTGVRISVSAARGLALALGIPAVGVSRLEALAFGLPRPVLVAEDARRNEAYVQRFCAQESAPQLLETQDLTPPSEGVCTGSAAAQLWPDHAVISPYPLAVATALIAATRPLSAGATARPAPLYLRSADALPPADPPPVVID